MGDLISKKLIQVISENEKTFLNDNLVSSYESASKEFDKLIEKGFAKRRENNLLSFTDIHLHRITLETPKNRFSTHRFDRNEFIVPSINVNGKTNFSNSNEF